jgi:hypothetical protein
MPWPDSSLLLALPWPHLAPAVRYPLLAAVVLLPLLLIVALYRYEMRLVRGGAALGLLTLRLLVLAVVLSLICLRPVHAYERHTGLPGRVIVVVDRSASMALADPQRAHAERARLAKALGLAEDAVPTLSRADVSRLLLSSPGAGLLEKLTARHEVELWGFARDIRELKPDQLDELFREVPGGSADFTDLSAPLLRAQERSSPGSGEVLAVVLITDGQHNIGPSPGEAAQQLGRRGVPVFAVALGDRRPPPDAAVVSVRGAEQTFYKGVEGVIEVKVKLSSLPAGEYVVELKQDGRKEEIAPPRIIQHEGKDRFYTEAFTVTLNEVGRRTLTAMVRPADAAVKEAVASNNQRSTTVSVADDRVRVLLADGAARWEYHYLASALMRDGMVELKRVLFEQPRLDGRRREEEDEKAGLPASRWPGGEEPFGGVGCVILGDLSTGQLTLEERVKLERFVGEGGGTLIVVAGKNSMPLGFPETTPAGEADPLRRLLPIENARVLAPEEGFTLSLTRAGQAQKFMELETDVEENTILWAGHPRPWGWAAAGTAKPGATALAGWLDPKDAALTPTERERRNAVVVRHNYGLGRVLYVGLDSTWRWRYKVGDLYHHRFWGQVVRWAAGERPLTAGNAWVRFGTSRPAYRADEAIDVTARLAEKTPLLRPDALAGARVIELLPDGKERPATLAPLSRPPARPRLLDGQIRGLPPGNYALELAIPEMAEKLTADGKPLRAHFSVTSPDSRELIDLETNRALLEEIAAKSGGRVFAAHEAAELADLLVNRSHPNVERSDLRLYQWWGTIALVVALLTLEWVGRKMTGLP